MPIAIDDVPETGRRVELAPDAALREAIAKEIGVAALPRLQAEFDLTRHGGGGLRVAGRVSATVGQICVVTLDPIQSEVDEAIDLVFVPRPEPGSKEPEAEGPLAIDTDEPPEALQDGMVDLGALATEFLMLGIDPYPRKPGAVFEAPPIGDPAAHPFAALAALKKGQKE
jgi:uncharacterized metal-binding protein YceD (DUF177 family)